MPKFADDPFEYVVSIICIGTILLIPLGPVYLPHFWILFLFAYFIIFLGTQFNHLYKFWLTAQGLKRTINEDNRASKNQDNAIDEKNDIRSGDVNVVKEDIEASLANTYDDSYLVHAFVVPNYAEPEALLPDTISRIAIHMKARTNYVIILAMEASELHHRTKAENLKEHFIDSFLQFVITKHPSDLPGEARGKGSNISYAARKGFAEIVKRGIDKKRIIITIADSDSHIPELYTKEVERAFNQAEDPYYKVFAPPIFFSRNCFKVPAAVRVTDITWSSMIMTNLSSSRGIGFPCSTYSISWIMADTVGYWDTDANAVGEDMHMTLKCLFKTQGRTRMIPIFVPINLINVETEGHISNLKARFVQAKRHYNGVADVAYTLRSALNLPTFCVDANSSATPLQDDKKSFLFESNDYFCQSFWSERIIIVLKVLEGRD